MVTTNKLCVTLSTFQLHKEVKETTKKLLLYNLSALAQQQKWDTVNIQFCIQSCFVKVSTVGNYHSATGEEKFNLCIQ